MRSVIIILFLSSILVDGHGQSFSKHATNIPPLGLNRLSLGDFNNDGLIDVLQVGRTGESIEDFIYHVMIYTNSGNNNFQYYFSSIVDGIYEPSLRDLNNDGYLDFVLGGKIFKNEIKAYT